ncbi:hypothetical protein SELMODRAFT_422990 [Selaginella moellendorffii]|uniref:Auxin efflux carrier component n=1 Tax=Selaginella moellendorffii TaxID=88036 RepID=D8SK80_SELML|nr:probable auxin efflux carrier component 1b isoform X2 [Selaginella moellendorffii]EFJ15287.1 hypothetical protein SELMODRAFT_422990 [Selaginella moellendorffii]|eukprot:XP_002983791.1 probable auxin efflux carrier component 1b isoform X2 [Selaginella moellendorffii]
MITLQEFYTVMSAVVPLYVAMILAYGSVRWWKLLTPAQCSGINRFVAIFAVPLLSFQIIAHNNPYDMNPRFVAADVLQKLIVLAVLASWSRLKKFSSSVRSTSDTKSKDLDWAITLFMVSTLPNTLVLGIPLEVAMYGEKPAELVVQAVVLQCIVWYTLLLFLYEYRSAKNLILEQFPGPSAANIVSFRIDPDVISLDGEQQQIKTEAEIGQDGKIHVQVKRSPPPQPPPLPPTSSMYREYDSSSISLLRSPGLVSPLSSKAGTPRASDLTGVEIYSVQSSRNMTPTGSYTDLGLMTGTHGSSPHLRPSSNNPGLSIETSTTLSSNELPHYSNHSSNMHTPREPPSEEQSNMFAYTPGRHHYSPSPKTTTGPAAHDELQKQVPRSPGPLERLFVGNQVFSPMKLAEAARKMDYQQQQYESREMQMLVWSSSNSPASDRGCYETRKLTSHKNLSIQIPSNSTPLHPCMAKDFSFVDNVLFQREDTTPLSEKNLKSESHLPCKVPFTPPKLVDSDSSAPTQMPPPTVMTKLIVRMMWKKLIRNPNTYASLLGLAWALISFRWNVGMPKILEHSITILSDAGLGMAMFSLGLFMALQSSLIACGTTMAVVVMIIRFVTGPAIMSATSIAVGLRNVQLRASIIQAALPQGIVPFVFAKEYNVHPDVLSTAVIFGMLISLPINLLYYVLLGL